MHILTLGQTGTGKTHLNKAFCKKSQRETIVLDQFFDPEWQASFKTADFGAFWISFWKSKNCDVFIEEVGSTFSKHDVSTQRIATQGRLMGHIVHFIAQRGAQVSPTIRDQCSDFYFFRQSAVDLDKYAKDWDLPQLMQARDFPNFVCFKWNIQSRILTKLDLR